MIMTMYTIELLDHGYHTNGNETVTMRLCTVCDQAIAKTSITFIVVALVGEVSYFSAWNYVL